MYIERLLTPLFNRLFRSKLGRCIILTGARQTGKTTFLKKEFGSFEYHSFDEILERETLVKRPSRWWLLRGKHFIFDEIQKTPDFFGTIKSMIDNGPADLRIILSGSAQIRLISKIRESLAGRSVTLELFPFTVSELARTKNHFLVSIFNEGAREDVLDVIKKRSMALPTEANVLAVMDAEERILNFGAMPPLYHLSDEEEKWIWLKEYCNTYLQRDLMDLARVNDLNNFLRLERIASLRTGGILNYSDLARDADISSATAKKYINHLEISYHVFLIPAFRIRVKERLIKSSKLYFTDLGIQRILSGIKHGVTGQQFENFVISEIVKLGRTLFKNAEFYYLRTKDGREVDLLIRTSKGYWAFEVKGSRKVTTKDARHLLGLESFLDGPLLGSFLVYHGDKITEIAPSVYAIPSWALWL